MHCLCIKTKWFSKVLTRGLKCEALHLNLSVLGRRKQLFLSNNILAKLKQRQPFKTIYRTTGCLTHYRAIVVAGILKPCTHVLPDFQPMCTAVCSREASLTTSFCQTGMLESQYLIGIRSALAASVISRNTKAQRGRSTHIFALVWRSPFFFFFCSAHWIEWKRKTCVYQTLKSDTFGCAVCLSLRLCKVTPEM